MRRNALYHWVDTLTLGLVRAPEEAWRIRLLDVQRRLMEYDGSLDPLDECELRTIVRAFTWEHPFERPGEHPILFTRLREEALALDLLQMGNFVHNLLILASHGVSKTQRRLPPAIQSAGPWFEKQAASYLTRVLELDPARVVTNCSVKGGREIDLAFVHQNILFIIECKAMAKDYRYMAGEHAKIRNRLTTFREELKKGKHRIELVRQGRLAGIIQPSAFTEAFALICTTAVEYLPVEEEQFWFHGLALVGTPEELTQVIRAIVDCSHSDHAPDMS